MPRREIVFYNCKDIYSCNYAMTLLHGDLFTRPERPKGGKTRKSWNEDNFKDKKSGDLDK